MIAYDEARQRILAACQPLAAGTVAVAAAAALDRATGCALPQTPVTVSLRRSLRRRRQPVERRLLALRPPRHPPNVMATDDHGHEH